MNRNPNLIRRSATVAAGRFRSAIFDSLGIALMEPAIALAMFSSAGTAALLGVGAALTSSDRVSASTVAENLADGSDHDRRFFYRVGHRR